VETAFERVESDVNLALLQQVRGVEDVVAGWADTLSDTVCLLNPTEMEAGRALLTGLDVFSEQSLVLPRLEIRKLLELEGGRLGKR